MDVDHSEANLMRSADPAQVIGKVIDRGICNRWSCRSGNDSECARDIDPGDFRIVGGQHDTFDAQVGEREEVGQCLFVYGP